MIAQYGQLDGYPEGQGLTVVAFLHSAGNIKLLKQGLAHTYTPTEEEVEEFQKALVKQDQEHWAAVLRGDVSVRERMKAACPSMSRETSAGILEVVAKATAEAPVPICLGLEFIHDGLFCEWAYVVDLDAEVLEVFHGLEKEREGSSQRFKGVDGAEAGWVPALVKAFAFAELPKKEADFIEAMNEALGSRRRERLAQEEQQDAGNIAVASVP